MKLKIVFALLILSAFLCNAVDADLLQKVNVDTDNEILTVSGNGPSGIRHSVNLSLAQKSDGNADEIISLMQFNTEKNGSYLVNIDMNGCNTGWYLLKIYSEGKKAEEKILYYTKNAQAEAVSNMLDCDTKSELMSYMDIKNDKSLVLTVLNINDDAIKQAPEEDFAYILLENLKNKSNISVDEARSLINISAVLSCLNAGILSLADYGELLGISYSFLKAYSELSVEQKGEFVNKYFYKKNIFEATDAVKCFEDGVILEKLYCCENYDDVEKFLNNYAEYLNLNMNLYNKLNYAQKYQLFDKLINSNITSPDDVKKIISSQIKNFNQHNNKNTVGGGSGFSKTNIASSAPAVSTVETLNTVAPLDVFDDLSGFEWALDAISILKDKKIINGTGNNNFGPARPIKREELVKMLILAAESKGISFPSIEDADNKFSDVNKDDWYYEYILKALRCDLIKGIEENTFGVSEYVTRQDAAVLIFRTGLFCGINYKKEHNVEFQDENNVSDYALNAVYTLSGAGVINGIGDNLFNPLSLCTRAQISQMIYRGFEF